MTKSQVDLEVLCLQNDLSSMAYTAQNTVISPNFLVWKFCGKAQFPHSFGRFAVLPINHLQLKVEQVTRATKRTQRIQQKYILPDQTE